MAAKIRLLLPLLALLMLCSCLPPPTEPTVEPAKDMPTMLTMGANYCQYCRAMLPVINKLKSEYRGKVNIDYVDAQRNPEYARRYRADGVPFTVFLDKNGRVLFSQLGYMDEAELRRYIQQYLAR